ncbi:hypothetical protein IKD56_01955 [bacterium]|nr:hypothetical protein [bacterium]
MAYRKQYENVKFDPRSKSILNIKAGQQYENIIDGIYSSNGGNEMKKIFDDKNVFDFPKPIDLIKYLINFHPNKNALVLDFFAGSGTTGQAVMELNKEDDGNRNFILVQLEEKIENNSDYKNIAEITIDRIKKAIEKYEYEKDKKFKVFKVKDTNFKNYVFENINGQIQLDIQDDNFGLKKDTKNLSLIYEIILKKNYELNTECKEIKQNDINY